VKVLTAAQMREADRLTTERFAISGLQLMENAGAAVAEFLLEKFAALTKRKIVVLCGKGNNGGDGLVAARHLKEAGCAPEVFLFANPGAVEGDAAANLKRWQRGQGELHVVTSLSEWEPGRRLLDGADLIVDALLGTGLRGPVEGLLAAVIEDVNSARGKIATHARKPSVVAVDIPSGLASDAQDLGGPVVSTDFTVTFCAGVGLPCPSTFPTPDDSVTEYTPSTGGPVVSVKETNPLGWVSTHLSVMFLHS